MSKPGSGSDLASLCTRAALDGDHFVVNGQKVWTSGAHDADFLLTFVRTDSDAPSPVGSSATRGAAPPPLPAARLKSTATSSPNGYWACLNANPKHESCR